jgi:signal transduction histidine kinase
MQVMDVLIGNAVAHGSGTVTASVAQADAYAEVRVADEGPHRTHGLGAATEIVEALGGHLRLTDDPCTTFSLVLPRARRETVVP